MVGHRNMQKFRISTRFNEGGKLSEFRNRNVACIKPKSRSAQSGRMKSSSKDLYIILHDITELIESERERDDSNFSTTTGDVSGTSLIRIRRVYIYLILIDVTSVMTRRESRGWSSGDKWSSRSGSGGSVKIINFITDSGGGGGGGGGGDDDNDDSGNSGGGNGGNIEIINFVRGSGGGGGGGGGGGENSRGRRIDRSDGDSSSDQVDGDWSSGGGVAEDHRLEPVKTIRLGRDGDRWPFGSRQGVRVNYQIFKVINLGGTRSTWSSGGNSGDVWSSGGSGEGEDRATFFKVINLTEEADVDGDFDWEPANDWI
uniref:Uncharacterized protein n=1 Tax=Glossina austeni TaxID=7395 RepID=A0A1A9VC20_GLOAU